MVLPQEFHLNPALLVIAAQPRSLAAPPLDFLIAIFDLLAFFHEQNLPVFHLLVGTEAESPDIPLSAADRVVRLPGAGLFDGTGLEEILWEKDVNTLVLCGCSADAFIPRAAREIYEHDFVPILAGDAMLGLDKEPEDAVLQVLSHEYALELVPNKRIKEIVSG